MKNCWRLLIVLGIIVLMFGIVACQNATIPSGTTEDPGTGGDDSEISVSESQYRVKIEITYGFSSPYVNAHVYEKDRHIFVNGAEIFIDGKQLTDEGSHYYTSLYGSTLLWTEGSEHSYKITTPDNVTEEGTFTISLAKLEGLSCTPQEKAKEYTIPAPTGGWAADHYVNSSYTIVKDSIEKNYGQQAYPEGNEPATITLYNAGTVEEISRVRVYSAIRTTFKLTKYYSETYSKSEIAFIGPETDLYKFPSP